MSFLVAFAVAVQLVAQPPQSPPANPSGLRIVIIAGEDAVNVIQRKTAVAPIVEVRDRNDQPVAGAIVTFTIGSSQPATFGGASTLSLTTNAAGRAAVAGLTPTGTGAVQINVAAAFQGQTATATIAQTNFATAAQAAASGSSASGSSAAGGGGSGGGIGAGTITAISAGAAAAGAGALLAGKKPDDSAAPPALVTSVRADPSVAAQATHVFFIAEGGATTGRWTIDAGGFFDFVQSGAALSGTYTATSTQNSGTINGTVGPGVVPGFENFAPGVNFTVTENNRQQFSFVGSVRANTSANLIVGGIGTPSGTIVWTLTRQ